jgi:hypothetical protein
MRNGSISHFSFTEVEMGNGKYVNFPFLILQKSKWEMRNEVDSRFRANEKWEMGCFTYFLFDIRQIGNRINGISPDFSAHPPPL